LFTSLMRSQIFSDNSDQQVGLWKNLWFETRNN
jgi:hypothetical protein